MSLALNSHPCSLSLDLHEMSLNIDMKMIRPVCYSGSLLISDKNSWTLLQSCNVLNPGLTHHQFCPKFCIVMNSWTTSTCLPMPSLIVGSHSSFQDITQNRRIHKKLHARDWWLLHHWPEIIVSIKNYPSWLATLQKSHLIVPISTFQICQTSVSKCDCSCIFWWNLNFLSNSFPCIQMLPMLKTETFPKS